MTARRQPQRKEPDVKNATPTAKARRAITEGPVPLSKEEVLEMERERERCKGKFMAAQEDRHAEELKEILAA